MTAPPVLPAPLTSAECNLQDFAFMPLDVGRLRDSDLASNETPEACWAAVLLWSASWHQVPAGSIPDDDKWMSQQTGYGRIVKEWLKVRAGALRGFVKCSDGRLYHPVVAEKAREAWQAKLEQRYRTECARVKKHNDRHGTRAVVPAFSEWVSLGCPTGNVLPVPVAGGGCPDVVPRDKSDCPLIVPRETASKGQGQGQGQGHLTPLAPDGGGVGFEEFWGQYPKHAAEAKARQEWAKLAPDAALRERILAAVQVHRQLEQWTKEGGKFIPTAENWLKGQRWLDDVGVAPGADPALVEGSAAWLAVMGGRLGVAPCGPLEAVPVWARRVQAAVAAGAVAA